MPQHFLLSRQAKTLTLAQVVRMSDAEAETMFRNVRWPDTDGAPVCPHCGGLDAYEARRPNGSLRFRCKHKECGKDFTITSGTLFASHKMPLRSYLLAVAIFCNEVKGKSMLALSRDLGTSYKCTFMLAHKLREAMASEFKGRMIGGDGKEAELDCGVFRRIREARRTKKKIALTAALLKISPASARQLWLSASATATRCQQCSPAKPLPSLSSARALPRGRSFTLTKSANWNDLHARYEMKRINHQEAYSARRRLHELGRIILLAAAPRGSRSPPPCSRSLFAPLRYSVTLPTPGATSEARLAS